MSLNIPSRRADFKIGIMCALAKEYDAVALLFDEFWDNGSQRFGRAKGDPNTYTTGRIGNFNVVLALPRNMGKGEAASAAASLRSSYGNLELVLLVGICGGLPQPNNREEILLGDIIISNLVVQYDFGRDRPGGFERKNTVKDNLRKPDKNVGNLLAALGTNHNLDILEKSTARFLKELQANAATKTRRVNYGYPGVTEDKLFDPTYRHKHQDSATCVCFVAKEPEDPVCEEVYDLTCANLKCDLKYLVDRDRWKAKKLLEQSNPDGAQGPMVHVGAIASGDQVIVNGKKRDDIAQKEGVIAFEMEGAGVWEEVPCIVVKGVCDYADAHKTKVWQNFAAATAAAVTKAILERYIQTDEAGDSSSQGLSNFEANMNRFVGVTPHMGSFFHGNIQGNNNVTGNNIIGGSQTVNYR